jgi:hypothetical protein
VSIGAKTVLTPVRAPNAKALAERWVRTVRDPTYWTLRI